MWSSLIWAIFFLIVLWWFRDHINALVKNVKNVRYGGFNISLDSQQDKFPISQEEDQKIYSKAFQSPIITNEEKAIKDKLCNAGFNNRAAIDVLVYQLANKNLICTFLFIDRIIFLEQIQLIKELNTKFTPVHEQELYEFFNNHLKAAKERNIDSNQYKYENFLGFLLGQNLISKEINGYFITLMGKEYLSFRIKFLAKS